MIRKKLLKISLITTIAATLLVSAGCGKKAVDNNTIQETKATVSTETKSVAAKEPTKTSLVTFDYTDENGEVHTMEGKIVADENGIATIQAEDTTGSIVEFKGNIITDEKGEVTVNDVVAKSDNPFVKEDGTDVVADADNTVTDESGNEGNNEGMKTETPNDSNEEVAPSEPEYTPSEPAVEPEPEAPAESEPSMTDEERLVATGHWDYSDTFHSPTRSTITMYVYTDSITGKELLCSFNEGKYDSISAPSRDDIYTIMDAHGIDRSTPAKEMVYML